MLRDRNLELVARVAERLSRSSEEFVFVGGAIVGLLTTDPAIETPRPTDDVDAIVQVASYADYDRRLAPELRRLGLTEDIEAGITCRWLLDGVKVDVMPTDSAILGFTNRWYEAAIANAMTATVAGLSIRVVSPPYFIATKLEAFSDRGGNDHYGSHDLEDILTVIDGREELVGEVGAADDAVHTYIARTIRSLLASEDFLNALPGHTRDPGRAEVLRRRLEALASLAP